MRRKEEAKRIKGKKVKIAIFNFAGKFKEPIYPLSPKTNPIGSMIVGAPARSSYMI